jgi:hypothetical protein
VERELQRYKSEKLAIDQYQLFFQNTAQNCSCLQLAWRHVLTLQVKSNPREMEYNDTTELQSTKCLLKIENHCIMKWMTITAMQHPWDLPSASDPAAMLELTGT